MADFKIDIENGGTGDLVVENGLLVRVDGAEAVRQNLRQRLLTFFGEWFLDLTQGIPYFEHVFKKQINPSVLDAIFKNAIINTPGVTELLEFDIDIDTSTRLMTLIFKVKASDETIDFTLPLGER
jgi:hypothetical protein